MHLSLWKFPQQMTPKSFQTPVTMDVFGAKLRNSIEMFILSSQLIHFWESFHYILWLNFNQFNYESTELAVTIIRNRCQVRTIISFIQWSKCLKNSINLISRRHTTSVHNKFLFTAEVTCDINELNHIWCEKNQLERKKKHTYTRHK